MALTSISTRLTPSVPVQITFDTQTIATGTKMTSLIGHMAATPGTGTANQVYTVINVGDPDAAMAEVDALAGAGSQIGNMAYAFVNANAASGGSNFPAFRVVMLANADTTIAPAAIASLKVLRSDMLVSCYPASDTANMGVLQSLASLLSGPDRDLQGQFGSFVTVGSLDSVTAVQAYVENSQQVIIASLPDSTVPPSQPAEIVAAAQAGVIMASAVPYNPLKGTVVGGLVAPVNHADWVQIDPNGASEALLKAGVSPMYVQPSGAVTILKTRTTYHLLSDGVTAVNNYYDWQQLVTLNDFREDLYQICSQPPFSDTKASVTVANNLKARMVQLALQYEDEGMFQGVKGLAPQFQVALSTAQNGRFDFLVPCNVLPGLDVIAINILATNQFAFTL